MSIVNDPYMTPGNFSPEEYYRMHGKLEESHINLLLDSHGRLDSAPDVSIYISEARAQYPEEDFLQGVLERLGDLGKRLRGDNRAEVQSMIEELEQIQMDTRNSSEEGLDQLGKATAELKKFEG